MAERKRAQFSELTETQRKVVSKRCYDVVLECNFRGNLIKEKHSFASPQFILDKAEYYTNNFASATEKLNYKKAKQEYESLSQTNGIYYRSDTKYQGYINEIVKLETMEELDKYIKDNDITLHSLNLAIADRSRALGDPDGVYAKAKEQLLKYGQYKYEKRAQANKDKSRLTLEENKYLAKIILQDFLDSEFIYKKDYCNDRKLSVNSFDKKIANAKEYNPEFYRDFMKNLEEKRERYYDDLKPVVDTIINNIKTDKNYNIIDYYLAYSDLYTFDDLCKSCNKYGNDIRALKSFFSKVDVRSTLTLDSFLEQNYTVNNHTYTKDEKEQLYAFAKEKKIPLNWHNISLLVAKQNRENKAHN